MRRPEDAAPVPAGEGGRRVEVHPGREAVVHFDPDRTFECVPECTWCCHHGVMLYGPDVERLADHADLSATTTDFRGEAFTRKEPKAREEHVGADGEACVFLDDDGLCAVQVDHDWKPARCSVFPLAVRVVDGDIHVDVREDAETHCDGLDVSERQLVDVLDAFLPPVLWELEDPATAREL